MRKLPVHLVVMFAVAAVVPISAYTYGHLSFPGSTAEAAPLEPSADEPDPAHDCGPTGQYQETVEASLKTLGGYGIDSADGQQSATDCAAIEKFQNRVGIRSADGDADRLTDAVARRLTEASLNDCDVAEHGRTVCVDLTHQVLWVVEDGETIVEPTVVRTGMPGHATTPGSFTINHRADRHWSDPYRVWLPYWQHYYAGEGLHEATSYLHDPTAGSHGCVNLLRPDAKRLYELLDYGDTIAVFGNRPGT